MLENDTPNRVNHLIDWQALQQRFNGRQAFIDKMMAQVLDGTHQNNISKLRIAIEAQDNLTIKFIAHNLKSLAGFFEAQAFFELALATDHAAQNQQENSYLLASQLADTLQRFLEEVKQKQSEN